MVFTDQINHVVKLKEPPKRIISLVPSQTELLYHLGLGDKMIGITKFCVHPQKWFLAKERVGGTKNIDIDKIKALNPDLILANKEENEKKQIESLQQLCPVWTSNITTLEEAYKMIHDIGEMTGTTIESSFLVEEIKKEFTRLEDNKVSDKTVLYLIWKNPYMSVGKDTFIHSMLTICGFTNVLGQEIRYPLVSADEIKRENPDFIFLSSEPYPFKEQHIVELTKICPMAKIILVDGEFFSWYGSRLKYAARYFIDLVNKMA